MKRADRRKSITVLVVGDEGVGKSSLISTFVSRSFSDVVPGIMAPVYLSPDSVTSCTTTVVEARIADSVLMAAIDGALLNASESASVGDAVSGDILGTDSASSTRAASSDFREFANVDSILLVYDLNREETFDRLDRLWLPAIESFYQGKVPVIIAQNKDDLYRPSSGAVDEQTEDNKRQQIISLMRKFSFLRQCIDCSAKNNLRVDDVFIKAQQAVLYPFPLPLFHQETQKLTNECKRAFSRIFRMFDRDCDGLLSDDELQRFWRETYPSPMVEGDLEMYKKVVLQNNPSPQEDVLQNGKFTVAGFMGIFDFFIIKSRLDIVWQALRKFGYDDDLNLHVPDSVITSCDENAGWKLSSSAKKFLTVVFYQFDSDKDCKLTPEDQFNIFSILPPPALPPWHPLRRVGLFGDSFSVPLNDNDKDLFISSEGNANSSSSSSPGQSLIVPAAGSLSQSLSQSGISILSASDSLPSFYMGTNLQMPISRSLSFLEWMGQWHLISAISPMVARAELFRLGHVEEARSKRHEHFASRRARAPKKVVPPRNVLLGSGAAVLADSALRSREFRVLVLGSRASGKTELIKFLRRAERQQDASSQEEMQDERVTNYLTKETRTTQPESSTTFLKLKRQTKSSSIIDGGEEEFVVHLIFTDVPEDAAACQEEHFRELSELFGSPTSPKDRMCDLAMLVFDCTQFSSFAYVKELESSLLTKETPRVFVGTKFDLVCSSHTETAELSPVVVAANAHCRECDLEDPLLVSVRNYEVGSDRLEILGHLARCILNETGVERLKAKPHEEQIRREAWTRKMLWIGFGFVVAVGVSIFFSFGSTKKQNDTKVAAKNGWFKWFDNSGSELKVAVADPITK